MDVDVRLIGANDQANELRLSLKRRVHGALERFAAGIGSVIVRMIDLGDLSAGGQKQCWIRVELVPSGISIIQESRSNDVYSAVDRAIDSIGRFFSWQLQRAGAESNGKTLKPTRSKKGGAA